MKTMLKNIVISAFVLFLAVLTLVACDFGEYVCIHEWSKWDIVEYGDCKTPGKIQRECLNCGAIDEESTELKDHKESGWIIDKELTHTNDGEKHIECTVCKTIIRKETTSAVEYHIYENDYCIYCNLSVDEYFVFKYLGEYLDSYEIKCKKGVDFLSTILLPETYHGKPVTSIGDSAFYGCSSLTSITIPDSVTSIGYDAFYGTAYYNNESNWVDGVLYIGKHLIKAKDTISGEYVIKDGTLTIADWAFRSCSRLTSITIPDSVASIGEFAFVFCDSLTGVTIPNSVTSIGSGAFQLCDSLTSITIPDSVASIGGSAFYNTAYYNDATNWIDGVLYIGKHLIKAKDTISGEYVIKDGTLTIGGAAFYTCPSLTSVTIPDSVEFIGNYAFNNCSSLTSITVDENNQYCKSIDGNLYTKDGTTLVQYAIGKEDTSFEIPFGVTSIDSDAFRSCSSLVSVTIPDSVTSIGSQAFYWCDNLVSVTIPDSVEFIGSSAFRDCSSLESVVIGDSVNSIGGYAFAYCDSLTDVYYAGTEEEWAKIDIDSGNTDLIGAIIHYNYVPEK